MDAFLVEPIARIRTPYPEKFAIPRQPGLVSAASAQVELLPPFNREELLRGLEGFSHIWLLFQFHQTPDNARMTVRPPRLGGNQRLGAFATRSPFRPNRIGMSVVKLNQVICRQQQWCLDVDGCDLLDLTPIVDIKPYIPYCDAVPEATASYADAPPPGDRSVVFSKDAEVHLTAIAMSYPELRQLIEQLLRQKPEPAYHRNSSRIYGMQLYDVNVRWQWQGNTASVISVLRASEQEDPTTTP